MTKVSSNQNSSQVIAADLNPPTNDTDSNTVNPSLKQIHAALHKFSAAAVHVPTTAITDAPTAVKDQVVAEERGDAVANAHRESV